MLPVDGAELFLAMVLAGEKAQHRTPFHLLGHSSRHAGEIQASLALYQAHFSRDEDGAGDDNRHGQEGDQGKTRGEPGHGDGDSQKQQKVSNQIDQSRSDHLADRFGVAGDAIGQATAGVTVEKTGVQEQQMGEQMLAQIAYHPLSQQIVDDRLHVGDCELAEYQGDKQQQQQLKSFHGPGG